MRFSYLLPHFHYLFLSFLHSFIERCHSTRANFYYLHMLSARQRWLRHKNLLREMRAASSGFKRQNSNYLYIRNFRAIVCYLLFLLLSKLRHRSTKSISITCICWFLRTRSYGMKCGPRHKKRRKKTMFLFFSRIAKYFLVYLLHPIHACIQKMVIWHNMFTLSHPEQHWRGPMST